MGDVTMVVGVVILTCNDLHRMAELSHLDKTKPGGHEQPGPQQEHHEPRQFSWCRPDEAVQTINEGC